MLIHQCEVPLHLWGGIHGGGVGGGYREGRKFCHFFESLECMNTIYYND